jgi:hypothetical protein
MTTLASPLSGTLDGDRKSAAGAVVGTKRPAHRLSRVRSDATLYLVLAVLVAGAWWISRLRLFEAGDDVGYWLGVAGGVMMLLLFSYPLRKHFRFMHRWGKVKWWFVVHMVLGIGGPLLILVHSTFRLGSVNATIALFSMLIVAGSGVAGRFLYLRIHRGLQGERSNLEGLQKRAGLAQSEIKSRFRFVPDVAENLLAFETQALAGGTGWGSTLWRVVVLPARQRAVQRACVLALNERLHEIARERSWSREQRVRRRRQAVSLVRSYLEGVVRVAQFTAYERLFALWHILHVPFVYLLILTAAFHVFAVHAY